MPNCWKTGKREFITFNEICNILQEVALSDSHVIIVGSDSVKLGY